MQRGRGTLCGMTDRDEITVTFSRVITAEDGQRSLVEAVGRAELMGDVGMEFYDGLARRTAMAAGLRLRDLRDEDGVVRVKLTDRENRSRTVSLVVGQRVPIDPDDYFVELA